MMTASLQALEAPAGNTLNFGVINPTHFAKVGELIKQKAFLEGLQKWAQEGGFTDTMADLFTPVAFGIGGYGLSKALGGQERTGVPDWLLGPAAGVGVAMPALRGIYRGIRGMAQRRRDTRRQRELEETLAREQEARAVYESQAQDLLRGVAAGLPGPVPPEAYFKAGAYSVPLQQADQVATQAQQAVQKAQQQEAQKNLTNAIYAQQVKQQFRGLGTAQARPAAAR